MSASVWPSDDELRQLLDGSLTAARQAELEALLEHDPALHQRLEALAGAHRWPQGVGGTSATAETDVALLAAIGGLKAQAGAVTTASDTPQPAMLLNFLTPSDQPGSIGRLGHYEVQELIGTGGFGMVLKAHDPKLNRVVAIKVLSPSLAMHATSRQRFLREAQNGAGVKHEDVVTIYHVDEQHQPPFLVMEYIAGLSLQQLVDRDGPLPLAKVLRIGSQAAEGLAAAHRKGLIHRDIKPSNILLENGVQRVKITDFGLSRAVDEASLTQSGVVAGTPQYMAPEQARGETVDYRSDLFSLGSVLYTMCAGRPAFRADSAFAVLKRVCEDTPRPLREVNPEIPAWLEGIIHKLMAKAPADRFSSAREVADLLDQCLAHVQQPTLVSLPEIAEKCAAQVAPAPASRKMPEELAHVRSQFAWPGLGLLYAGALNLSLMLIFAPSVIGRSLDAATVLGLGMWGLGSLFTLFAGVAIREPRITWLFYVGAALGMVMPPGMLIGLPCALWIFWLLAREDVQAALHNSIGQSPAPPPAMLTSTDEQRLAAARQRAHAPAIGMRIVGLLNLVGIGLLDIWRVSSGGTVNMVFMGLLGLIALTSLAIILGAFAMLRLRHYRLAILAAILCMIVGPSTLIGLPIGIWALVVLLSRDVRDAFAIAQGKPLAGKPAMAPLPRPQQATAIAIVALVMAPLFCLLPVVGVLGYFFTSVEAERPQAIPEVQLAVANGELAITTSLSDLTVEVASLDYLGTSQAMWQWPSEQLQHSNNGARLTVAPGRYHIIAVDRTGTRIFEKTIQVRSGSFHTVRVVPQAKRQVAERAGPDFSSAGHEPRSIVLSPDGQWMAAGLKSDKWLFMSTDPTSKVSPKIVSEAVGPIAFSHDGQWMAVLKNESDVVSISSTSNSEEPARALKLPGEDIDKRFANRESAQAMAFSPDGETFVVACSYAHDKESEEESSFVSWIHRFELSTGKALPPLGPQDGIIEHMAFPATKSDSLVSISNSQLPMTSTTILWDITTQKIAGRTWDRDQQVDALVVSPQGGWIYRAVYAPNGEPTSQAVTNTYPGPTSPRGAPAIYVQPLRTRDATGGFERPRALLKAAGRIPLSLRAHALTVSPNGQWLAIANEQDALTLWQATSPDRVQHVGDLLDAGYQTPVAIAFSRDSSELILCGRNLTAKRWDLRPWLLSDTPSTTPAFPVGAPQAEQPPPDTAGLQKIVLLAAEDLQRARDRFTAGNISQTDVYEAEAKHLEAQIDYATALGPPAEVIKHLTTLLDVRRQQAKGINELLQLGITSQERANDAQAAVLKVEHRLRAAEAKNAPVVTPEEPSDD